MNALLTVSGVKGNGLNSVPWEEDLDWDTKSSSLIDSVELIFEDTEEDLL